MANITGRLDTQSALRAGQSEETTRSNILLLLAIPKSEPKRLFRLDYPPWMIWLVKGFRRSPSRGHLIQD